jgi:ketosteroid isomerase-like protein
VEGNQDHESIIRLAYTAFASRDVEALKRLSDPEIEVTTVTAVLAGRDEPYRGYEGLETYIADVAATWTRLELFPETFHRLDEERTLVLGRVRAWRAGASADSPNAWVWTIRDGKVVKAEVFADPSDARRLIEGG